MAMVMPSAPDELPCCGLLLREAAEAADEENSRHEVRDGGDAFLHSRPPEHAEHPLRDQKPPAMLIAAKSAASAPRTDATSSPAPTCSMPPMMMMPLIAFVTLMSGVWSAGVTLQMTCQPTKHARMNTVECWRKSRGAKRPATNSTRMRTMPPSVVPHARRVGERMFCCAGFRSGEGGGRSDVRDEGGATLALAVFVAAWAGAPGFGGAGGGAPRPRGRRARVARPRSRDRS